MRSWFETVLQDVRYGARLLRTNKGFAAVAILSLALGIGANTAIFQLIDAVRLRTLPVNDPQQLAFVRIPERHWGSGSFNGWYSWLTNPIWEQIRSQQQVFSSIAAFGGQRFNLARGGEAREAQVLWTSGDFFKVLQVPPLIGRVFTAADDQRGCSAPGAVISYSFWQREYGGAASVLGKTLTLESHPFEIVGVTPAYFYGLDVGRSFDVAIPICAEPILRGENGWLDKRHFWWLGVVGRLKPGVSLKQANAQMQALSPSILEATVPPQYDADGRKHYFEYKFGALAAANGTSRLRTQYENPLWMLLGIAGLVLLIACANLANLMLARASARERELAIRLSVGASRGRLVRQLLFESLLLAFIGAVLGAVMAQMVSRGLIAFLSNSETPVVVDLGIDWRLLGFTALLAVLTCLLFGLAPALRATRMPPAAAMNAGGRTVGASREKFGLRRALVVMQIALSLVLVAGALLFTGTLRNLLTMNAGFQQNGILVVSADFRAVPMAKDQRVQYAEQIAERMRALPGVDDAALNDVTPIAGDNWNQEVVIGGQTKGDVRLNRVSEHYFKTMGMPLVIGRDFGEQDQPNSPKVAVVNEMFAAKYFGGNALGKTFHLSTFTGEPDPEYQIVGVVKNAKYSDLHDDFLPGGFFPTRQDRDPGQGVTVMIRSRASFDSLTSEVKRSFAELNPAISLGFASFQQNIRDGLLKEKLMATLSGFFGALAAILAAVGVYGVIAYMVARRTNEIGIRMALGATPGNVLSMILREAGLLVLIGAGVGLGLAVLGGETAKALLYGLKPHDPRMLSLAVLALGAVAIMASYWPAHRAARLEPMKALREQ
jgi:putative ABC transport system permease protein